MKCTSLDMPVSTTCIIRQPTSNIENSTSALNYKKIHSPPRACTTVLPYTFPPLIIGGNESGFSSVVDISVYNVDTDTWSLIDMLKTRGHIVSWLQ